MARQRPTTTAGYRVHLRGERVRDVRAWTAMVLTPRCRRPRIGRPGDRGHWRAAVSPRCRAGAACGYLVAEAETLSGRWRASSPVAMMPARRLCASIRPRSQAGPSLWGGASSRIVAEAIVEHPELCDWRLAHHAKPNGDGGTVSGVRHRHIPASSSELGSERCGLCRRHSPGLAPCWRWHTTSIRLRRTCWARPWQAGRSSPCASSSWSAVVDSLGR